MKHPPTPHHPARVRRLRGGMTLEITLILLLIVLVIGAAVARGTFVQTKISSNFYDREIAFQAAQAALRVGEARAKAGGGGTGSGQFRDCSTAANPCLPNPFNPQQTSQIFYVEPDDFDPGKLSAGKPQYVIEYLGKFSVDSTGSGSGSSGFFVKNRGSGYGARSGGGGRSPSIAASGNSTTDFYRITARSSDPGNNDRASVTLQSIYHL